MIKLADIKSAIANFAAKKAKAATPNVFSSKGLKALSPPTPSLLSDKGKAVIGSGSRIHEAIRGTNKVYSI
jgi:hypothetical protein